MKEEKTDPIIEIPLACFKTADCITIETKEGEANPEYTFINLLVPESKLNEVLKTLVRSKAKPREKI